MLFLITTLIGSKLGVEFESIENCRVFEGDKFRDKHARTAECLL